MQLVWEDRTYESGINQGVFYPEAGPGVVWNGLTSVVEQKVGGERTPLHFDGIKYYDMIAPRDYQAQITAFAEPQELLECLGNVHAIPGFILTRQPRKSFGFSYRTNVNELDYRIHLVYNASVIPHLSAHGTLNATPTPMSKTWTVSAVPNPETDSVPTPHLIIDSRKTPRGMLELLEHELYGRSGVDPYLPSKDELVTFLGNVITEPLSEPI